MVCPFAGICFSRNRQGADCFPVDTVRLRPVACRPVDEHAAGKPEITPICSPVEKVNDTTFTVRYYRMGMDNPRRTNEIWLLASHEGDADYKSAVQQFNVPIPYRNEEGGRQCLLFPELEDVKRGTETVSLNAVSDCGLPVYYYVKEGPAEVQGNKLMLLCAMGIKDENMLWYEPEIRIGQNYSRWRGNG